MRFYSTLLVSLVSVALAGRPEGIYGSITQPDIYEAIHQREFILAETLDTKDYDRLSESLTQDVVYDSRPLGPDYGALSVGLPELIANLKKAFGNSNVAHHVSNAIIKLNEDATKANVTTYIVYSKWDPTALHDPKKTFRIYERCDDLFVLDSGTWKMKYSLVTNLAPKVESPYFSGGHDVKEIV